MKPLFYVDAVIDFVLCYPEHKHYIAVSTDSRFKIERALRANGKIVHYTTGPRFGKDLLAMDNGELDILLSVHYPVFGWFTRKPCRTLSFVEPIDLNWLEHASAHLRGANSRLGFSIKGDPTFNDVLIETNHA